MSQGTSSLQHKTLQHQRYCGIVCCQKSMRILHASISRICISKLQWRITNICGYTLATQQSAPTENTDQDVKQFLDYCATHPDSKIRFFESEMILQFHSDASYMNETKECSAASGHYLLGNKIKYGKPIILNGNIHTLCKIIGVSASAAEDELGSIFLNTQETVKLQTDLQELGNTKPPTLIHTDNTTATGIIHKTIKQQRSRAMNMRYFWTISKQDDKTIDVSWHPERENIGDYASKHHSPTIRQNL